MPRKLNSLDEQSHPKALPQSLTRSETTSKNCRSQKPKRAYRGTLVSSTTTELHTSPLQNISFHELVKADKPIKITNEIIETFENINKALDNAWGLWLKQPLPNKQYVLKTDANFKNAGYALMIEENADEKLTSVKKTYAPIAFGPKTFSSSQIKMSIYDKEILAICFAFMEFSHILWGSTRPVIVITDHKSVTRFF